MVGHPTAIRAVVFSLLTATLFRQSVFSLLRLGEIHYGLVFVFCLSCPVLCSVLLCSAPEASFTIKNTPMKSNRRSVRNKVHYASRLQNSAVRLLSYVFSYTKLQSLALCCNRKCSRRQKRHFPSASLPVK